MSESGDRKAGMTGVPPQVDRVTDAEDLDYSDVVHTRAGEGQASDLESLAHEADETLIMTRARQSPPRIGLLPPPQLPPFRLPTVEPPPAVSIREHSDADIVSASRPVPTKETETAASGIELGRPLFAVAAIGVALAGGAVFISGRNLGLGVGVGALTATLNFWVFTRIGAASVSGRRRGAWGLIAALKLILLFGAVFFILKSELASPLAFLLGYLALPVGIVASQFLGLRADFENGEGSI